MKRTSITRAIAKRRRRRRLKKLKQAALTVGLATAWGATAEATSFTVAATATLTLSESAFVLEARGSDTIVTSTITAPGLDDSTFDMRISLSTGLEADNALALFGGGSGYYYIGVSGDDLVLSFPNGGDGVIGEFWGSLFLRNGQGITEDQILDQLRNTPLEDGSDLDPDSPLGILNRDYGELLRTPFGSEAELVAFTENAAGSNNGISGGQVTLSVVPEPTTLLIVYAAGGMTWLGSRRRG